MPDVVVDDRFAAAYRAAQGVAEFGGIGEALFGLVLQGDLQHVVDPQRHEGVVALQGRKGSMGGLFVAALPGQRSGEHFMNDHRHGKQIALFAGGDAIQQFRGAVIPGAKGNAGIVLLHATTMATPEIHDANQPAGIHHDVVRLQVAMDYIGPVQGADPVEQLVRQIQFFFHGHIRMFL